MPDPTRPVPFAPAFAEWHCPDQNAAAFLGHRHPKPSCQAALEIRFEESERAAFFKLRVPVALKACPKKTNIFVFILPDRILSLDGRPGADATVPEPVTELTLYFPSKHLPRQRLTSLCNLARDRGLRSIASQLDMATPDDLDAQKLALEEHVALLCKKAFDGFRKQLREETATHIDLDDLRDETSEQTELRIEEQMLLVKDELRDHIEEELKTVEDKLKDNICSASVSLNFD
ncbi:hypothetical protein GTA08_BOTSDO01197 [Neofusicoccum parvum]|nr:hypothetical protein GTA08_BOTSDO01197 [Neofusicoccum parvum]